jgi:hypothetical protein
MRITIGITTDEPVCPGLSSRNEKVVTRSLDHSNSGVVHNEVGPKPEQPRNRQQTI